MSERVLHSLLVVDACVAVKWFVEEEEAENARRLLTPTIRLLAPDVFVSELGSVLLKKARSGEMARDDVPSAIARTSMVVDLAPAAPLADIAFEIAYRYSRSFYDALYVALALREDVRLVTCDSKLINGMGSPFQERFVHLRDV